MMKTLNSYIDQMLGALSKQFPSTAIHYAFLADEGLHVVDLMGNDIDTLTRTDWAAVYNQRVDGFEHRFPGEFLLLVREGDFVRVSAAEATKQITPETLAATLPNSGAINYTWPDKLVEYIYEMHELLRIPVLSSQENSSSPRRVGRKRKAQASESTFTFDSVLTGAGTESFCVPL